MSEAETSTAVPTPATRKPILDYLPASLFGGVMGLAGLSIAWSVAHKLFGAPVLIAVGIGSVAIAAFVILSVAFLVKLLNSPGAVVAEFNHLIAGNLFGTFAISLLLLPVILSGYDLGLARGVWVVGAVLMVAFSWVIVTRWFNIPHEVAQVTPTWIVPAVGLLDLPIALPALQWPQMHEVAVFGLAGGLVLAIPVFTLNFARLIVGARLPDVLQPALLMLVAPFAVGFSAYMATAGHDDLFADSLYMLTLFMYAVIVWRLIRVLPGKPFRLGWWGTSFPLAASAGAALRYAGFHPGPVSQGIAIVLLAVATLAIAFLMIRTLMGLL